MVILHIYHPFTQDWHQTFWHWRPKTQMLPSGGTLTYCAITWQNSLRSYFYAHVFDMNRLCITAVLLWICMVYFRGICARDISQWIPLYGLNQSGSFSAVLNCFQQQPSEVPFQRIFWIQSPPLVLYTQVMSVWLPISALLSYSSYPVEVEHLIHFLLQNNISLLASATHTAVVSENFTSF